MGGCGRVEGWMEDGFGEGLRTGIDDLEHVAA